MSAKDLIHEAVRNALIKDGWNITHDPLTLEYAGVRVFADLGAERVIGAERDNEKIAVEIKSFVGRSLFHDLEEALGQYIVYRRFLQKSESPRQLYLAINYLIHETDFQTEAVQMLLQEEHVSLLVVDVATEEVKQWIQK